MERSYKFGDDESVVNPSFLISSYTIDIMLCPFIACMKLLYIKQFRYSRIMST